MKIEIGESLMLSWLRHDKNCQLVQINWKPSVNSWEQYNEAELDIIMKEAQDLFYAKFGIDLFKGNSSCSQLLQQGEIDALGVDINSGSVKNIYGIDIAFHESGLNYGTKEVTVARVVKKMIRSAMVIRGYFNVEKADIIFAAPKVHNSIYAPLEQCFMELNDYFGKKELAYHFSLICNDTFRDKIFNVVSAFSKSISDTSELFMRSVQMYNLFNQESISRTNKLGGKSNMVDASGQNDVYNILKGFEEMKVGALVRMSLTRLIDNELLDANEIERLKQSEYSKKMFNINYPFLKDYEQEISEKEQTMINGYKRYFAKPYQIDGQLYFLCNDWYEDKNRSYFIAWLKKYKGRLFYDSNMY
jgi:hypothetical protein